MLYAYRVLATGSAFLFFNLGGLILTLTVFPLIRICLPKGKVQTKYARKVIHYTFKGFVGYMRFMRIISLQVDNVELLKQAKGKVVIANHPSLIDVVVLISLLENADCVVKSALWRAPFIGGVVRSAGYIANDTDPEEFIQACKSSLSAGANLVVFPEGTRTTPGELPCFKRGAGNIAVRTQSDFLPVLIDVSPTTLTKGEPWYKVSPKRVKVHLVVLPEYQVTEYSQTDSDAKSVRLLTKNIEKYIRKEMQAHG
ncbi:lysophospholipid acyltransferase family protein [Catenovulum agarivorans]|nr:lysophospholipid acyltransferase family protein [Catenovulum agarivorans]